MRAAVRDRYGTPDVIEVREISRPELVDDGVLVRVRACSVNPYDYFVTLTGVPFVARIGSGLVMPRTIHLGVDFAGTVEAVGRAVTGFEPGDDLFGFGTGAFAEYVCVRNTIVPKPAGLSFEEAAAVPSAAITALQAVGKAPVQAGQTVLINGAAGGVGTFAVQLANSSGAVVTGVCSTENVQLVRSLGADHVVDYTREDFTRGDQRYDVVIDNVGNRSWSECRRVLAETATWVLVGGRKTNRWLGPLSHWGRARVASLPASQRVVVLLSSINDDLETLRGMLERGILKPVIDRAYPLSDIADALAYVGEGHARAKVVISL